MLKREHNFQRNPYNVSHQNHVAALLSESQKFNFSANCRR